LGKFIKIKVIEYFNKSDKWRGTSNNGKGKPASSFDTLKYKNRLTRISYSHEYIGESIIGFEDLLLPINEMREINQTKLF
jgi:hypothetical protein